MEYINGSEAIETLYTLPEAREIIRREAMERRHEKQRQEARKKRIVLYYIKQKLSGLIMLAIGILTPFLLDGDATFSLFAVPMGLYLIFTRSKIMDFRI